MKKLVTLFLAVAVVATALVPMQGDAFADGLVNQIKGSNYSCSASYGPSSSDIMSAANFGDIQFPNGYSYLENYSVMYVNAPKKLCAYVYKKPDSSSGKLQYAYQGSKIIVLAKESGYSCVLYTTQNNVRSVGWIDSSCLTPVFNGISYDVGNKNSLPKCYNYGDAYTSWSNETFIGTNVKYTKINALPSNLSQCRGMTIEYKITGRGTNDDLVREVFVNYGDGWESYGTFNIDKNLSPVRVNFCFENPVSVMGVAVVPTNPNNYDFAFRQTVVDVLYD